jgi:hypothetical protein
MSDKYYCTNCKIVLPWTSNMLFLKELSEYRCGYCKDIVLPLKRFKPRYKYSAIGYKYEG